MVSIVSPSVYAFQDDQFEISSKYVEDEWNLTQLYYGISAEQPELSHEEILDEMYEIFFGGINTRYIFGLNSDEFWIIVSNLWPWQYGTAQDVKNKAIERTDYYYDGGKWGNDADAFRHTYFAALLTLEFGSTFALDLTDAHEATADPGIDRDMDLHNNLRGIALYAKWASDYYTSSNKWNEIARFIVHAVRFGKHYNIVRLDNLTNPQYFIYTTIGNANLTDFPLDYQKTILNPIDYGFEPQYFFYPKYKIVNKSPLSIETNRLRTGYIENELIVMSANRAKAGTAYLEYKFDRDIELIDVELMMWSGTEGINQYNGSAVLEYKDSSGNWIEMLDLFIDITLTTKQDPISYDILFEVPVREFRFVVNINNPYGDRNKGRVCIGTMNIYYE